MADCIFCKIAQGEIPSTKVYDDDTVLAFRDLDPQAPEHVLIIPKKHLSSVLDFGAEDRELAAHILTEVVPALARTLGIDASRDDHGSGWRTDRRTSPFPSAWGTFAHMAAGLKKASYSN